MYVSLQNCSVETLLHDVVISGVRKYSTWREVLSVSSDLIGLLSLQEETPKNWPLLLQSSVQSPRKGHVGTQSRSKEKSFHQKLSPARTFITDCPTSPSVKTVHFCCLGHPGYGILFRQPRANQDTVCFLWNKQTKTIFKKWSLPIVRICRGKKKEKILAVNFTRCHNSHC